MNDIATPPEVRFRTEAEEKARHEGNKLTKRLARETTRALSDYNMIEAGDRVMVCLSGGKDSYAMLDILLQLQKRAPFPFEMCIRDKSMRMSMAGDSVISRAVLIAPLRRRGAPATG